MQCCDCGKIIKGTPKTIEEFGDPMGQWVVCKKCWEERQGAKVI